MEILYHDKSNENVIKILSDKVITIETVEKDSKEYYTIYTNLGFYFILTVDEIEKIKNVR